MTYLGELPVVEKTFPLVCEARREELVDLGGREREEAERGVSL